jgi:hypothetical protein
MQKKTKRRTKDTRDAVPGFDDDATVVTRLVDAINRAIPTSTDPELETKALRLGRETAPREMSPREVAYHEAGHAVVARNFGLAVTQVSISPASGELFDGQPREGYMRLGRDAERHTSLQRRLWIALAGLRRRSVTVLMAMEWTVLSALARTTSVHESYTRNFTASLIARLKTLWAMSARRPN